MQACKPPQVVIRHGRQVHVQLPDYDQLDQGGEAQEFFEPTALGPRLSSRLSSKSLDTHSSASQQHLNRLSSRLDMPLFQVAQGCWPTAWQGHLCKCWGLVHRVPDFSHGMHQLTVEKPVGLGPLQARRQ